MKRPDVQERRDAEAERERAAQLAVFERRLDAVIEKLRRAIAQR